MIEGCRFWLQPLPGPVNGFAAGIVPGENAVDTKVNATAGRSALTIRNSEFFGFRGGLICNMAALNLERERRCRGGRRDDPLVGDCLPAAGAGERAGAERRRPHRELRRAL